MKLLSSDPDSFITTGELKKGHLTTRKHCKHKTYFPDKLFNLVNRPGHFGPEKRSGSMGILTKIPVWWEKQQEFQPIKVRAKC